LLRFDGAQGTTFPDHLDWPQRAQNPAAGKTQAPIVNEKTIGGLHARRLAEGSSAARAAGSTG